MWQSVALVQKDFCVFRYLHEKKNSYKIFVKIKQLFPKIVFKTGQARVLLISVEI